MDASGESFFHFVLYMPGPEFLLLYFFIFLCCIVVGLSWSAASRTEVGTMTMFIVFELVGAAKLFSAFERGHHNVGILVVMMIFGGVMFFIKHLEGTGFGGGSGGGCSSFSSCSSGSSCGGGCGGGGCGGCGG